jgi:carbamoyl-phosphate synthase large subunit
MEIVYDEQDLRRYFAEAVSVSNESPVLLDRFLDDATEVDVDAICDGGMWSSAASWSTSNRPVSTW